MSFRTVFIENKCRCSYQGGYMVVRKEDGTAKIHLSEISSIVLQTTQVYISAYLLMELAKAKIALVVSDEKENPVGEYLPLYGAHNPAKRVQEQMGWGAPIKKRVWQRIVRDKIGHQAELLKLAGLEDEAARLASEIPEVKSGDITNREAYAARLYFSALFGEGFSRSSDCATNAALNYGYAIILSMVNREIVSKGYLTQIGIFHRNEYNQFNLACDLMEPFRPIVDRLVIDNVGLDFEREDKLLLADIGNRKITYRGGAYKVASVVSLYVQDCLNALCKRNGIDEIEDYSF